MVDTAAAATKLQKIILSWDYWDLVKKAQDGKGPFETLTPIPATFKDVNEYKSIFEPLLLEECCAQVLRGVEEGEVLSPHPCVCALSEAKEEFLYARLTLQPEDISHYVGNDLVLLCKHNPVEEMPAGVSQAAWELHALGVCEEREGERSIKAKFRLTDESQAGNEKGVQRVRAMRAGLESTGSCWWLLKLSNMSTIAREWVALQHAHCCPFIDILMNCQPRAAHESRHMDIPPGMNSTIEAQCNPSQMDALRAGLDGTPLVLIQGPPGTGKTRTILNLLSVIMHAASKNALAVLKSAQPDPNSSTEGTNNNPMVDWEERASLWQKQAPWVLGEPNPRDLVTPYDEPEPQATNDCWGLLARNAPIRLGKETGPKAHVLVCAPSNSALDEIVLRIMKHGLMDKDGNMYTPSLVRIGQNAHHSVKPVCLEAIVDARLGDVDGGGSKGGNNTHRMERDRMRIAILEEASVVCSTLSYAGSHVFQRLSRKFDVVVIDEAAQAVEPATLVPLIMQGCKQVYLVGDPVQLPATVISTRAVEYGYNCSLFKRLQGAGYPIKMLDTQYRMNPAISTFPSQQFYNGHLLDGESVISETIKPWHDMKCFGPLAFFDVSGKEAIPPNNASIHNISEANMVLCIYRELVHRFPALRQTASVAVISPYKAQVKLIKDSFKTILGEEAAKLIDVNTIDGFQGREKDIVIFSCVRSLRKGGKSIGFVADERRINVGLTRARCSLLVVGNARALQASTHWASLIHHTMTSGCLYRPKAPFADWMHEASGGKVQPVQPTAAELAALDKARKVLAEGVEGTDDTKEVDAAKCAALAESLHEGELGDEDEGEVAKVSEQKAAEYEEKRAATPPPAGKSLKVTGGRRKAEAATAAEPASKRAKK